MIFTEWQIKALIRGLREEPVACNIAERMEVQELLSYLQDMDLAASEGATHEI